MIGPSDPTTEAGRRALVDLLGRGLAGEPLENAERRQLAALVEGLLPPREGALDGHRWEVFFFDLPAGDHVGVELFADESDVGRRLWMQILPAPEGALDGFEREALPDLQGRPVVGREGHHLFVRAGEIEVRIVADPGGGIDPELLRQVLAGTRLDLLAEVQLGL